MTPEQALALLHGMINAPAVKLALNSVDIFNAELAVRTLRDAIAPKPVAMPDPAP